MKIELTQSQIFQGALLGIMRQAQNIVKQRKGRYGADDDDKDWQKHIEGCLGEIVVAQYLGIFWDGKLGVIAPGDVGKIEVRTTPGENNRLIVQHKDPDEAKIVLLTGKNGTYQLRGWIYGKAGKNDTYWTDPAGGRPAFFVPQKHLEPIETLAQEGDTWQT